MQITVIIFLTLITLFELKIYKSALACSICKAEDPLNKTCKSNTSYIAFKSFEKFSFLCISSIIKSFLPLAKNASATSYNDTPFIAG